MPASTARDALRRLVTLTAILRAQMFFRGQIIGKYKILSTIGSGGFGTVYLAEDTWIDKKVALKVPHKQGVDFGELLREPRLLASLNHPNIVTILTAEKQENVFFIVMEFVPGETLETIIAREGPLDVARALDYTCQISNAVDHAHRQGVLHRDLRPSNVLVADSGMLKVADFGTSRFLEIAAHGTTVIGSPPVHGARAVSRQGRVRLRHLLARRDDVPDDDRRAAVRHAVAGRSRSPDEGRAADGAAAEEPEDPEVDQRHRPEGDGAGDPRALPARGRAARRRAGGAIHEFAAHAAKADADAPEPAEPSSATASRRTSTSASRRARRRNRASAGTAASRSTRDRIAARFAARPSDAGLKACTTSDYDTGSIRIPREASQRPRRIGMV